MSWSEHEHVLTVPLDHDDASGPSIEVFARAVIAEGGEDRPWLVFLQGGPGVHAPRTSGPAPWLERALRDFRVLLLDQRGTGRSTPLGRPEDVPGETPAEQAAYLSHFRADAIVRDAEALREHLGVRRWSLLGQSFGGFTSVHYLSAFPDSLASVLITGGLPVVGRHTDEVYAATYDIVRRRARAWGEAFPAARERLVAAVREAEAGRVVLPNGHRVSGRMLRTVGGMLGQEGGAEQLRDLLDMPPGSVAFAHDLAAALPFGARNPLYAVIHESSYADGVTTDWSGQRTLPDDVAHDPSLLTAEHVFDWHFSEDPALAPWAPIAAEVARLPWPSLYDPVALADVDVPSVAMVYTDDVFVDRGLSLETAALIGGLEVVERPWEHNALRIRGADVLDPMLAALGQR